MKTLASQQVLVIGRPTGLAGAIVSAALEQQAHVVLAGRHPEAAAAQFGDTIAGSFFVDATDDSSIAALAEQIGNVDHIVSTVSARARGFLGELTREKLALSFATKVIGPAMVAQAFQQRINPGGSLTLFSGVAAFKPVAGYLGVAITNGAVATLVRSLAVELAPLRVNAISPGVIDTGAWDAFGPEGKEEYFEEIRRGNPVGTIGQASDIADAVVFAMTNPFLTGETLHVEGGEALGYRAPAAD